MANTVREHQHELASLLTLEQGKPLTEALAEIKLGADYIQWFAEEARRINGEIIPSPWKDRQIHVTREPVGVVGAISPWNFPFSMLARKVAPALAAGCTVVVKPSELTPYCGLLWGVLAEKVGLPAGVINVVTGDAVAIGGQLTADPRVRKLTFTGSTGVGKLLYSQSAATMKKLSLELGALSCLTTPTSTRPSKARWRRNTATVGRPAFAPTVSTCRPVSTTNLPAA